MKTKKTTAVAKTSTRKLLVSAEPPSAGADAAARINHWHEIARQSSEMAITAALNAGLELFRAKLDHPGTFEKWIEANCEFGRHTAYRYLALVQQALSADDLPKLANGSDRQRGAAVRQFAANTDSKTLTDLYCNFGIIKKTPSKMGGYREGAGRKKKDAAAEERADLDAAANSPALLIAAIREPISAVYKAWRERDVFARIELKDLSLVAASLNELSAAATAALKSRSK